MRRGGAKGFVYDDAPLIVAQTIIEKEKVTFSGLYDANGKPLHREEIKVGFDLNERRRT